MKYFLLMAVSSIFQVYSKLIPEDNVSLRVPRHSNRYVQFPRSRLNFDSLRLSSGQCTSHLSTKLPAEDNVPMRVPLQVTRYVHIPPTYLDSLKHMQSSEETSTCTSYVIPPF